MSTILENPKLYDALYSNLTDDIDFYLRLLKDYPDIIEYGAGTGRITIPLAQAGHRVIAVDIEKKMLMHLQNKIKNSCLLGSIDTVQADITTLILEKEGDCILVPFTTFNYLLDENSQKKCMSNIANSLRKNGIAVFELLTLNTYAELFLTNDYVDIATIVVDNREYYKYSRKTWYDRVSKLISQKRRFIKYGKDKSAISFEEYEWCNRYIDLESFIEMSESVGLSFINAYGDTNGTQYSEKSNDLFVVLKK